MIYFLMFQERYSTFLLFWSGDESNGHQVFALDLIDHLPRCRISTDTLKAILACMEISGTPDVPSFSALQSTQTALDKIFGLIPQKHTSSLGNVFYMNPPSDLISLVCFLHLHHL